LFCAQSNYRALACLFTIFLLVPVCASSQISIQNEYDGTTSPTVTVGAGSNLGLVCSAAHQETTAEVPTGVTFNGDAMTIGPNIVEAGSGTTAASIWYLINPDLAVAAPVFTYDNANSTNHYRCYVLTGFVQATPLANSGTAQTQALGTTELACNVTEVDGGFGVGVYALQDAGSNAATWTDFTEDYDDNAQAASHFTGASALLSTTNTITPGVTTDGTNSRDKAMACAVFSPAAGSAGAAIQYYLESLQ